MLIGYFVAATRMVLVAAGDRVNLGASGIEGLELSLMEAVSLVP